MLTLPSFSYAEERFIMRIIMSTEEKEAAGPLLLAIRALFMQAHIDIDLGEDPLDEMLEDAAGKYPKMVRFEAKGNSAPSNVVITIPVEDSVDVMNVVTNMLTNTSGAIAGILSFVKNMVFQTVTSFDQIGRLVARTKNKSV